MWAADISSWLNDDWTPRRFEVPFQLYQLLAHAHSNVPGRQSKANRSSIAYFSAAVTRLSGRPMAEDDKSIHAL